MSDQLSFDFDRTDWEEIQAAIQSKIAALEGGFYGYETKEGEDEDWVEDLKTALDAVNSILEEKGDDLETPDLTDTQWAEVYYSLDSKINGIKNGFFGVEEKRGEDKKWIKHLESLKKAIAEQVSV